MSDDRTKLHPGSLTAYVAAIHKGDDDSKNRLFLDAIASFKQAIEIKPEMYEAYFKLGNAYLALDDMLSAMGMPIPRPMSASRKSLSCCCEFPKSATA